MAMPAPGGGMQRSAWKDPTVQDEFAAWALRFTAVGLPVTSAKLQDITYETAVPFMHVRDKVLKPFQPYYKYCGTWQSWRMFVAPHRYPASLHIDVHDAAGWRTVYSERSTEQTWLAEYFDHDRFRSSVFRYSWEPYKKQYSELVTWIAGRAARDFQDASQVRVQYEKYRSPSPEEVRSGDLPPGKFQQIQVVDLDALRHTK